MGEPVSLLGFFLSAASTFGRLVSWLRNTDRDNRERIATFFDQIASCMREVAERIESGDPPRDTCRRLAVYTDELQIILGNDSGLVAAGDASIDETRQRLTSGIEQTRMLWMESLTEDPVVYRLRVASDDLSQVGTFSETNRRRGKQKPKAAIDRLAHELESEFVHRGDVRTNTQAIWDASGEFAALADALRAR
jgi:hypothetical protein